ncbi:phenylpyruvate tautomerase PptA (4-oxalocrotonate tautomerase family) [Aequitasia blattaphilus]|uniref:Tautomerase family protein n=1 Tax=Aequitasia blattaphilus TaxID=2949332 RepID=A0ABT1E7L0_9FIRM|nr:tautomerase family protein [Aequitasia blattaphilus]MCP1101818.1 tautomerase family protein [Aequitasia blattaphilus]MCR8614458.1 tautomerase family protein [Aequitasia blattaphilus]
MPLIKIDVVKGKSSEELQAIADVIHESVVKAFHVPQRDRYQIITQHENNEMILLDTGLGFEREEGKQIAITVFSRKRAQEDKINFYHLLQQGFEEKLGINSKNLLIAILENGDPDWSFGFGNAQFITGELS